eukprot:TRINITY_DN13239_c0_g1_i2.p1 TRINITY_DN13239_c0_g1~~TRINITY_DN13239_c0_g1_i2.p1  ORF type:complete len:189 (-),score=35.20 TRINITY_DN13239_c0_g1_i2:930-1496(-)
MSFSFMPEGVPDGAARGGKKEDSPPPSPKPFGKAFKAPVTTAAPLAEISDAMEGAGTGAAVPSQEQPAAGSEFGGGRRKPESGRVQLGPGFSQVDWLRQMRSTPPGPRRRVSIAEVREHKSGEAIWTILFGNVYNISPYLKYHPGGVEILMKVAGRDATALFNKYHAWVNYQFMLEKCFIGPLDSESS